VKNLALFLLILIGVASPAKADDPTFGQLLKEGWRVVAVTKDSHQKSCFLDSVAKCELKDQEDSTVFSLTKEDGLAFCIGSYWWRVSSKSWVCEYTRIPGAAE
jgi:hypothetical protein